jgi:hypothetical protein
MEFMGLGKLSSFYKMVNKEYLIYGDYPNVTDELDLEAEEEVSKLQNLRGDCLDEFENEIFGIETAILLHKVGLTVKRKNSSSFDFAKLSPEDILANDYFLV